MPANQPLTDFGWVYHYVTTWMANNFWNVQISFWGMETTIGFVFAWVFFGTIFLGFVKSLIGYYID